MRRKIRLKSFIQRQVGSRIISFEHLFLFIAVYILTTLCAIGGAVYISHVCNDVSLTIPLILLLAAANIAIIVSLFFHLFRHTIANSNKLQEIYNLIPSTHRSESLVGRATPKQMADDIMAYYTMLQNKELLAQYTVSQSQLSALQSQINPHFLFNTLESIRGYCFMNGQRDIAQIIEALSSLFRNCLQRVGALIPFREELQNVKRYIALQQFRFPGRFVYKELLDDDDRLLDCMLPNLTIQPIIENAIFHGLENKIGTGEISLRAYLTDTRLVIQVSDNGSGIERNELAEIQEKLKRSYPSWTGWKPPKTSLNQDHGIGMININLRLRLRFGDEYGITVSSTKNVGTQIHVTLPINL